MKKLGSGAFGEIFKGRLAPSLRLLVEKKKTGEFFAAKIVSTSNYKFSFHDCSQWKVRYPRTGLTIKFL